MELEWAEFYVKWAQHSLMKIPFHMNIFNNTTIQHNKICIFYICSGPNDTVWNCHWMCVSILSTQIIMHSHRHIIHTTHCLDKHVKCYKGLWFWQCCVFGFRWQMFCRILSSINIVLPFGVSVGPNFEQ